jgi:antitoxin PrlF
VAKNVAATATTKDQITIPASVRASLNIKAEDRIEFIEMAKGKFKINQRL